MTAGVLVAVNGFGVAAFGVAAGAFGPVGPCQVGIALAVKVNAGADGFGVVIDEARGTRRDAVAAAVFAEVPSQGAKGMEEGYGEGEHRSGGDAADADGTKPAIAGLFPEAKRFLGGIERVWLHRHPLVETRLRPFRGQGQARRSCQRLRFALAAEAASRSIHWPLGAVLAVQVVQQHRGCIIRRLWPVAVDQGVGVLKQRLVRRHAGFHAAECRTAYHAPEGGTSGWLPA
jgi:hypothetical protein